MRGGFNPAVCCFSSMFLASNRLARKAPPAIPAGQHSDTLEVKAPNDTTANSKMLYLPTDSGVFALWKRKKERGKPNRGYHQITNPFILFPTSEIYFSPTLLFCSHKNYLVGSHQSLRSLAFHFHYSQARYESASHYLMYIFFRGRLPLYMEVSSDCHCQSPLFHVTTRPVSVKFHI